MSRPRRRSPVGDSKSTPLDYKDPRSLSRFITERGKVLPRRQTGLSAKQQRALTREIKRARELALLPYVK